MINLVIFLLLFLIQLVSRMVLCEGATTLDHLVEKMLRCKYHKQKYIKSLDEGIIPTGLRINKKTALTLFHLIFITAEKQLHSRQRKVQYNFY